MFQLISHQRQQFEIVLKSDCTNTNAKTKRLKISKPCSKLIFISKLWIKLHVQFLIDLNNLIFEFLYDIQKIKSYTNDKLISCCKILQTALTDLEGKSDINSNSLICEFKIISGMVPEKYSAQEVLELIYSKHLQNAFPETVTAIKILLTLPVTVASGERTNPQDH